MRKTKKLAAIGLSAVCATSSIYAAFAAESVREAWNNAASTSDTGTELSDGSTVYPNVYADADAWAEWKEEWETIRDNFTQIALTPGSDETSINAAWYSLTEQTPEIRIVDASGNPTGISFTGTIDTANAVTETLEDGTSITLYPNKVTVSGVEENTTYYYQYLVDGEWSDTYTYTSQSTDSFSVLYVGDPQIGASKGQTATEDNDFANSTEYYARNDAYNWNQTLLNAYEAFPDVSFILSAGDQINQTNVAEAADSLEQQVEYAGFLYSSVLRSLPIATTIGNHDSKSVNYQNHFNNPNSYTEATSASVAGDDYYFTYGNTLFVIIDTNNYNCQDHADLINEALEANPDVTWKILMFHQDIYGSGYDHSDSDGMLLRTQLTSIIDEAGFDAVLQGHDHTYSRTYQISASEGTFTSFDSSVDYTSEEYQTQNASCYNVVSGLSDLTKVVNPSGTVYFEANSASGSKFYQLISTQQDYIAARCQTWRPTYSVIEIDEVSLTVKTYDAATGEELVADGDVATSYTIVKSVDKTNLETKLADVETYLAATDVYTADSLENLQTVYDAAMEIYENDEATSVDVASAYTSLTDAIDALVKIEDADEEQNNSSNEEENNVTEEEDNNATEEEDNNATEEEDNNVTEEEDNNAAATGVRELAGGVAAVVIAFASMLGIAAIIADEKRLKKQQ